MSSPLRPALLAAYRAAYDRVARPLAFRGSPGVAHERALALLRWLDERGWMQPILGGISRLAFPPAPTRVGGVTLPHPLMLAAGFVKGEGFASEAAALDAVRAGRTIIPGWRSLPRLVGAVEFGSFTRWPRTGNPGVVLWRDPATRSLQNRVGLRNPGAAAAAAFLAARREQLPPVFGVNIAVSPGVDDPARELADVCESVDVFLSSGVRPGWFTLNLSCPNTEDDPLNQQTEARALRLCGALSEQLRSVGVPLWVKLGPDLAEEQYRVLLRACAEGGVQAIIATNTLAQPTLDNAGTLAGISGGRLYPHALRALQILADERQCGRHSVDLVACGGVLDGAALLACRRLGAQAAQVWSALVYRGPLAAALILHEAGREENR